MKTTLLLAMLALASCTPSSITADLSTYGEAIKANPKAVKLDPADVTIVNTVNFESVIELETDYGNIEVDQDGVKGALVIDISSNK